MEDWGVSTIRSLRQRVEELDKGVEHWRKFYEETRAAQTSAEARLAQCVEALLEISGRALASQTHEIGPLEEVEDARSYAAEIAQGVSHYPHEEAEPCVRCRAERAEAEVENARAQALADRAFQSENAQLKADIRAALEEIEQRGERLAQWEREEVTRAANCCGQEERAEAAEAAHREAAAQWQDESRLRREAEAKLAEAANARVNWGAALAEVDRLTAEVERLREALRECQRVFDHPAFTDRAGIGDVVRAALRGER